MRFEISYRGQNAGWVAVEADTRGMVFQAQSELKTQAVLRLYALTEMENPLRIGVMEPESEGTLCLKRRITLDALRTAGVTEPPVQYYLEDGEPGCQPGREAAALIEGLPEVDTYTKEAIDEDTYASIHDPLLRRVVQKGIASYEQGGEMAAVYAPFSPGHAHPLNFVLTACTIEREGEQLMARLRIKGNKQAEITE